MAWSVPPAKMREALEKAIAEGEISIDDARIQLGLHPWGTPETQQVARRAEVMSAWYAPPAPNHVREECRASYLAAEKRR